MDNDFRRNLGGEEQLDFIFEGPESRHAREYAEPLDSRAAIIAQRYFN